MGIFMATLCVASFVHLFIEMPIATLWSYVMIAVLGHNNRKLDEKIKQEKVENEHTEKSNL